MPVSVPNFQRPSFCFPNLYNYDDFTSPGDGLRSSIDRLPNLCESPQYNGYLPVPSNPPTVQDWQSFRPLFTRLYKDENRPWKEVQAILERDHGFKARHVSPSNPSVKQVI